MSITTQHWLTKRAELSPTDHALEFIDGRKITFQELQHKSETVAKQLASTGVKEKSRVAILSGNCLEMIVTVHAISYLGAVAVLLNTRLTNEELTYQLQAANTYLLITTEDLRLEKRLDFSHTMTFSELAGQPLQDIEIVHEISLDDPFTMMFTSGTTGLPKAVLHTYGNHWWSATGSALNLGLHDNDKWLLPLPIFHIGGFSILQRSIIYGIPAFVMEKYDAQQFYDVICNEKITIVSLVTLMLRQLVKSLGEDELPGHVRCLLLGGGAVPEDLLTVVKEKSLPLFQSYGMTETSSQIVTLSAEDALRKLGSSGKALFPAQVNIIDSKEDNVGEIIVKGPMVMQGYVDNPEANETSFLDGWLRTGDLGYLDEEGFLYVVERRTDLIISGGENIYPTEIESKLLQIPGISDAGVYGEQDDYWGEVPVACIVRDSNDVTENVIKEALSISLATYKLPKKYYFVDSLPRNASNKLMRHQLKNIK